MLYQIFNFFLDKLKTDLKKYYGRNQMEAALAAAIKASKLPKASIKEIEAKVRKSMESGAFDAEFALTEKLDGKYLHYEVSLYFRISLK
jgi:hypothetical protein